MSAQNIACRAAVASASLRLPRTSGCEEIIFARDIVGSVKRLQLCSANIADKELVPLTGPHSKRTRLIFFFSRTLARSVTGELISSARAGYG